MAHGLGNYVGTRLGSWLRPRPSTSCIGLDSGVVRVVCLCPAVLVLMTMTYVRDPRVGTLVGSSRVAGVRTHRKGCQGGELRLVSRQFLW